MELTDAEMLDRFMARDSRYDGVFITGVLTTGIAHEINNPMNFISGGIHAISTLKNELLREFRVLKQML